MKTVVQEKCLQLVLAACVMGWLGEQWLLPCWVCDSFSSTSFLVLLFQSHPLRCLKHPGAVTGGNGGSWEGAFCLGGGSWIEKDLWIEIQICDFFLLSRLSSRIKSSKIPHFLRKSNPRKPKLCFAWYILSCAICGTARNHWHGEVGATGLV